MTRRLLGFISINKKSTELPKKESGVKKVFIAIGNWIRDVITFWVRWLILVLFMFLPPITVFIVLLLIWIIEPHVYTIITCPILIVVYWLAIFKTRLGRKYLEWVGDWI